VNQAVLQRPSPVLSGGGSSTIKVTAFVALGFLVVASAIFERFFARTTGITPASLLLAVVVALFALRCGPDLFHPARLLAGLLGLGFVIGPIIHAVSGRYVLPDGSARQVADLPRAGWIVLAGALLAFLAMKAVLGEAWGAELHCSNRHGINERTVKAALFVGIFGSVVLAGYFILTGIGSISLQGRGATYAVIPHEGRRAYLGLLAPIGLGGILIIVTYALEQRTRRVLVAAATAAVMFGAIMALPGSRANFLYAVVPLVLLYAGYRGVPRPFWLTLGITVLLFILFYSASLRNAETRAEFARNPLTALVENRPRPARIEDFLLIDVVHTEPLLATMDAYPASRPFLTGESAALGFTGPAGWKFARSIGVQIDPPAGVTATATAYGRDPSTFGTGLTATLPGELYANAGVLGVLGGLALFGGLAGAVRRRALSSSASGSITLYTVQLTILFAIFADYIGQFYRVGVVLAGVVVSLVAGGEKSLKLARALSALALIAAFSIALLTARRFFGDSSSAVLTSMIPTYLVLGVTTLFIVLRTATRARTARPRRSPQSTQRGRGSNF
jgi:hypothetical protein